MGRWEWGEGRVPLMWAEGSAREMPACCCDCELVLTSGAAVAWKTGHISVMPRVTFPCPVSPGHAGGPGHGQALSSCMHM